MMKLLFAIGVAALVAAGPAKAFLLIGGIGASAPATCAVVHVGVTVTVGVSVACGK